MRSPIMILFGCCTGMKYVGRVDQSCIFGLQLVGTDVGGAAPAVGELARRPCSGRAVAGIVG